MKNVAIGLSGLVSMGLGACGTTQHLDTPPRYESAAIGVCVSGPQGTSALQKEVALAVSNALHARGHTALSCTGSGPRAGKLIIDISKQRTSVATMQVGIGHHAVNGGDNRVSRHPMSSPRTYASGVTFNPENHFDDPAVAAGIARREGALIAGEAEKALAFPIGDGLGLR